MYNHQEVTDAFVEACVYTDELDWELDVVTYLGIGESTTHFFNTFVTEFLAFLNAADTSDLKCIREKRSYTESEQLGHDLWLTCNGHGAGFWDGDWEGTFLPQIIEWCKGKEMESYVGDDGYVYISGHEVV